MAGKDIPVPIIRDSNDISLTDDTYGPESSTQATVDSVSLQWLSMGCDGYYPWSRFPERLPAFTVW